MDRIPNRLVLTGSVAAVLYRMLDGCFTLPASGVAVPAGLGLTLFWLLLQTAAVLAVFYPLYKLGVLGAGDVKLYGMSAAFLDSGDCMAFLAGSLVFAAMAALCKLLWQRNLRERLSYFLSYLVDVLRLGSFKLYCKALSPAGERQSSLHMAGPMLAGLLCHMLGLY